ncbi:hypothetical protein [Alkalihalobacillus sp. R86527]|uniref:hypothetical protein n=1 Tax=Alkalihalobacillus sp. R86527 TaxID=3093863 RepID=UPI00366AD93A
MSIHNLKVLHNSIEKDVPKWIVFANKLGEYLYDHGSHYNASSKIVISLPTQQYFSLFVAMGIADKKFSINKQTRSIQKTFLSLGPGRRIIYIDDDKTREMSVLAVEESPVFKGEMLLHVKDGSVKYGIPERQWLEKVIILDEEHENIKKTMKVKKGKQLGLTENTFLKNVYPHNQLNKNAFFPGDHFYLVGNLSDIEEWLSEKIFISNGEKGSLQDFLFLDSKNSYTNGKLISSQKKKLEFDICDSTPVIFSDSLSYLNQKRRFLNNPQIIITSRTDSESRFIEIMEQLKMEYLQNETALITEDVQNFLRTSDVEVPSGIELMGWRCKS